MSVVGCICGGCLRGCIDRYVIWYGLGYKDMYVVSYYIVVLHAWFCACFLRVYDTVYIGEGGQLLL